MKRHHGEYPCPIVQIPGWMSGEELEWLYQRAKEHQVIVEVGSAFGRSSHALLTGNYLTFGAEGRVYCVDNWPKPLSGDHFDYAGKATDRRAGFLNWCMSFPNLNIWEMPSDWAASMALSGYTIRPSMIFLDGGTINLAHDVAMWKACKSCSLLCGHDYDPKYPELHEQLNKLFGLRNVEGTSLWYVERNLK